MKPQKRQRLEQLSQSFQAFLKEKNPQYRIQISLSYFEDEKHPFSNDSKDEMDEVLTNGKDTIYEVEGVKVFFVLVIINFNAQPDVISTTFTNYTMRCIEFLLSTKQGVHLESMT